MNGEVALGTKVFKRTNQLEELLDTVPEFVTEVIVADDGEKTEKKKSLYSDNYKFELTVIDLEYDAGLGYGRKKIAQNLEKDYILIVDTDHRIPHNIDIIIQQLETQPSIGGIAGSIIEPDHGRVWQNAADLYEKNNDLILDRENKKVEYVADSPLILFDFIPNAAIFRKECLSDYCWDPNYVIEREHIDFYTGHWKKTDWEFAICPEVLFPHFPGGSDEYLNDRFNQKKRAESTIYFLKKWGYNQFIRRSGYWYDTGQKNQIEQNSVRQLIQNLYYGYYIEKEIHGRATTIRRGLHSSPNILYNLVRSLL